MLTLSVLFFSWLGVALGADTVDPMREHRGIWVTRWTYRSADQVREIMDEVAQAGFNAVYFQVRGQHDAFYRSDIEPWAKDLTGVLGQDPGWDPLAVAVEAGHERGLEVHAYLNAFPMWRGETPPGEASPEHVWRTHPDWVRHQDAIAAMQMKGEPVPAASQPLSPAKPAPSATAPKGRLRRTGLGLGGSASGLGSTRASKFRC